MDMNPTKKVISRRKARTGRVKPTKPRAPAGPLNIQEATAEINDLKKFHKYEIVRLQNLNKALTAESTDLKKKYNDKEHEMTVLVVRYSKMKVTLGMLGEFHKEWLRHKSGTLHPSTVVIKPVVCVKEENLVVVGGKRD